MRGFGIGSADATTTPAHAFVNVERKFRRFMSSTLPDVVIHSSRDGFTVREISKDAKFHEEIWNWHQRRPGFNFDSGQSAKDFLGADWRNYCFFWETFPLVCISIQERCPNGFEIHVACAAKTHPDRTKQAVKWIGDLLTAKPNVRLISWFPKKHVAALRLNRHFMEYETELNVDGETWVRFATNTDAWKARFAKHG